MEFYFFIYGAIAFFSLVFFFMQLQPRSGKLLPPEAGGKRLFTGHLHLMSGAELPHFKLASLADKYGPIYTLRLGVHRALVVSGSEFVKELFTTCDMAVSNRPKVRIGKHTAYNFASFGFAPYGPYWRAVRKLTSAELLSTRRVELLRNTRVSEINHFVRNLYKVWEEERDESGRVLVDMKKWLGDLNFKMILRLVAGKMFDNTEEMRHCEEVFREFFRLARMFVPADALPYLGWLDIGGHEKKMKENARELERIVGGWLSEHREKEYSGEGKAQDFMDVMVSVMKDNRIHSQYDDDTIIKSTCQALILGGTDTSTVTIVWGISLLLNNPRVMKNVQRELDEHVGKERRVEESDISNLVYLQAVMKEIMRLYPPGSLGGNREFSENCNIGGYHIEKGTWLIVNVWKLHRDPRVWGEDALEFKPERFLGRQKDLDVRGQDFELIPFGAGRRVCPGTNFALQMMHLVLANVVHAFEVSTASDGAVDMSESAGITNMKATPLDVLVAPRLSPSLY